MSDKRKNGDRLSRRRDHDRNQERNNNMYKRLCQTLAAEHRKLRDLEQCRERLMVEMRSLRARFLRENAVLRRTAQRGPTLPAVLSPPAGESTSAPAVTAASMRPSARAHLPAHVVPRGVTGPNRIPVRSVSFASPSPVTSRQRPAVSQQGAPSRQSQKKEEQSQDQRQASTSRKVVRFPRAVTAPTASSTPNSNSNSNSNPKSRKQPPRNVSVQNRQKIEARPESPTAPDELLSERESLSELQEQEGQPRSYSGFDGIPSLSSGEHLGHPMPNNPPPSLCDSDSIFEGVIHQFARVHDYVFGSDRRVPPYPQPQPNPRREGQS